MTTLWLSIMAVTVLPTPNFATTLPLPVPKFELVSNVPQSQAEAMATHHSPESPTELAIAGRRMPGPRHWHCPTCRSSSCLMYLGNHLRSVHGVSMDTIDSVTYRRLTILHDNLHNANYQPGIATKQVTGCSTCEGGRCSRPILRRLFGRR